MSDSQTSSVSLELSTVEELCSQALLGAGASPDMAGSLAQAAAGAERRGKPEVGVGHMLDFIQAMREGRLNGTANPTVAAERKATITVDAHEGTAQLAFDVIADELVKKAHDCGTAVLSIRNSFAAGELGHYTHRMAEQGLIALAGTNSSALMSVHGAKDSVTGTNPMSFALPHPSGPRMFDQAASATAWVKVRDAADAGQSIPEDWALDEYGDPTQDAEAAMSGALLPFGGVKAGNIALMIDMLAGLSGANFSLDAAPFDAGDKPQQLGLFMIVLDPSAFSADYPERAEAHLQRLKADHGVDFGRRKAPRTTVELDQQVYEALLDAQRVSV